MWLAPLDYVTEDCLTLDRLRTLNVAASHCGNGGWHIVIRDGDHWHRLWIRTYRADASLGALLPFDRQHGLRTAHSERLYRMLMDKPLLRSSSVLPSPYQHHRLSLLLAILDLRGTGERATVSLYDIADTLLYRDLYMGRGASWKSSSERRQTQRHVAQALAMMRGGYRALLQP